MPVTDTATLDTFFDEIEFRAGGEQPLKAPSPAVPWICEHFIDPVANKPIYLQPYQRRILRHALQFDRDGYSRYSLVVWSQIKKSGKTAIAGAVGAWVANEIEQPNEVSCVANDQEQSAGRIFAAMKPTLVSLGWNVSESPKSTFAYNSTGSIVKAITTRYQGEAGANPGISLWSELWAYSGERLTRLWEEMTPPPTRKFSMRWVETYAGFRQESLLLYGLYQRIFRNADKNDEKALNPGVEKLWDDLPAYAVEDEGILVFWDHLPRMPWQTDKYYQGQRSQLRPNAFQRLHGNWWVDSSGSFITQEMWNTSCRREGPLLVPATYALDMGKNNDCVALVGCVRVGGVVHTTDVHIWESVDGSEYDQNDVMQVILDLRDKGLLRPPLWYDPYQCVKMAQDLRLKGVPCMEFSQGADRTKADTSLYKLYKEGEIVNWAHPGLRRHILSAAAREVGEEEYRIEKPGVSGKQTPEENQRKVDAAVAQSMAAYKAYKAPSGGWTLSGI